MRKPIQVDEGSGATTDYADFPTGNLKVSGVDVVGGGGGGGGTPGGANTDVQINDAGAFGVATNTFKFNKTINSMAFGAAIAPSTVTMPQGNGSLTHGEKRGTAGADYATFNNSSDGSVIHGVAETNTSTAYAAILVGGGTADGAHAGGMAYVGAGATAGYYTQITAYGKGAFSHGYVTSEKAGQIRSSGRGSVAHGCMINTGTNDKGVQCTGDGSGFIGYGKNMPTDCSAGGKGAILLGQFGTGAGSGGTHGIASADGSIQVGNGENTEAQSMAVGEALRFCQNGLPASLRNGDMWQAGGGYVYVRSNGVSVKIT